VKNAFLSGRQCKKSEKQWNTKLHLSADVGLLGCNANVNLKVDTNVSDKHTASIFRAVNLYRGQHYAQP
jgi:hypothetical protein